MWRGYDWERFCNKLHKWHIIWPQGVTSLLRQKLRQIYWLWHVHSLEWHSNLPNKKRGKLKFYWTIWSTLQKKKSMQHISGLWGTSWIYIDISTFLEKLFKVILFLIIPIDSIKYLVSYFFFTFCPTSSGRFFFFFWDCFESAKHKYWSFYAASTLKVAWELKMIFSFYVAHQILSKPLMLKSGSQTQWLGVDGEEKDPTKGTHKKPTKKKQKKQSWMFSVSTTSQQTVVNCHTTSYVPFVEVYNVRMHCKYAQMCIFPL